MKKLTCILLCLLTAGLSSCASKSLATSLQASSEKGGAVLFNDAEYSGKIDNAPQAVRSRFVTLNTNLLLDKSGKARDIKEITFNIFPDVEYIGLVEDIQKDGSGYSWTGSIKDVQYSAFFMVYTDGIFMIHVSSPLGIYEVSNVSDDLYQAVMIDQTKYGGGQD